MRELFMKLAPQIYYPPLDILYIKEGVSSFPIHLGNYCLEIRFMV